jgi:succinoglycan biosynthesis protein ExoO
VSVIVAAWKAAGCIERSIGSALASTGVRLEVIVIDDASPDGTSEKVRQLAAADARIVAERLPENSGPSVARNRAIELARGRYVAVLDADDAMLPGRLASLVAIADKNGADIVADNMTGVDEAGRTLGDKPFLRSAEFGRARDIDLATWISFNQPIGGGDCLGYLKPLIRRAKLVELGIAYDPSLRNSEDYYVIANLLAAGARMTYSPDAGYLYTRSTGSTSHRLQPSQTRAWLDAEKRFQDKHAPRLSAGETAALARRERMLRNVNQLIAVVDAVKARKFGASLGLVASDMRGSAFTFGALAKVAIGKILRRKLV